MNHVMIRRPHRFHFTRNEIICPQLVVGDGLFASMRFRVSHHDDYGTYLLGALAARNSGQLMVSLAVIVRTRSEDSAALDRLKVQLAAPLKKNTIVGHQTLSYMQSAETRFSTNANMAPVKGRAKQFQDDEELVKGTHT
jgi:hypothetical protein